MDKQRLSERLDRLDVELRENKSLDENERENLCRLRADIQEFLQNESGRPDRSRELTGRLRERIQLLEASHPNISLLLGEAADLLSKIGI